MNENDIPIQSYQEEQVLEPLEPTDATSAVIGAIFDDGVTLIFDGNEAPSNKHYKVNTSVIFSPGDHVKISKDSNTYIVEFPYGSPKKPEELIADLAKRALTADDSLKLNGKAESALSVNYASSAGSADSAGSASSLTGGGYTYRLSVGGGYIRIYLSGHGWYNLVPLN